MPDGTIVKPKNAVQSWEEDTRWNGSNHISIPTGSQFAHQKLHKTRRGRYWLEHWSDWQGSTPHAEWVSEQEAARWLLLNGKDLPDDLERFRDEIEE
jgi:hypothetical protein